MCVCVCAREYSKTGKITLVISKWRLIISVARSGWRFPAQKLTKTRHFNKNQPKILTAKIMWYDFITMSIKINKDHFYLLKIK